MEKMNNVGHEASRHFRNKKGEYLKDKINELAMNSKDKNMRLCISYSMASGKPMIQ
jgi:hypothetical protein